LISAFRANFVVIRETASKTQVRDGTYGKKKVQCKKPGGSRQLFLGEERRRKAKQRLELKLRIPLS
jgi:hypothetical protein